MEVGLSSAVSTVSFSDESPVVISLGTCKDVVTEDSSVTTFIEQAGSEVLALYETAKKCNDTLSGEIAVLNQKNTDLGQQLEASMGRERELKILHGTETQVLEDEVALLQAEMNQLREAGRKEAERFQKLLEAVSLEKTAALATAKASREQQKTQMNQETAGIQACVVPVRNQVSSLKSQVSLLTTNLNRASNQVPSLTQQRDLSQRQVDAVDARGLARLKEMESFFNQFLDLMSISLSQCGAKQAYECCRPIFSTHTLNKIS